MRRYSEEIRVCGRPNGSEATDMGWMEKHPCALVSRTHNGAAFRREVTTMARPTMTREIAWAAAQDEANRSMRKAGRKAWSRDDYNAAVETFDRLWPIERELE